MSKGFKALLLRRKLMVVTLIPLVLVSLIILYAMTAWQIRTQRESFIQHSSSLCGILSRSVSASLVFRNREAVLRLMQYMRFEPSALYALVVSSDGEFSVDYSMGRGVQDWQDVIKNSAHAAYNLNLLSDYLVCSRPVEVDDAEIGSMVMVFDARSLRESIVQFISWVLVLLVSASFIAYIAVRRLHRGISDPMQQLIGTMQRVSRNADYSIRAGKTEGADMRELYRGFDRMLEQIEIREEQLDKYRHGLEMQIAQRGVEIEQINRRRISWLENMAFFLHHELRNKIVGFRSTLDIIERRGSHVDLEKYLARARKSLDMMSDLLKSVASASDIEAALFSEFRNPLDLSKLISEQLQEYGQSFPQQRFRVEVDPGIRVRGNQDRLSQAVEKLLNNAMEHAEKGSTIRVRLFRVGEVAQLEVINIGDRLPENREELFEMFVSSKRNRDQNRGLGLFVARLIVENHGGRIAAQPLKNGKGARFMVHIPTAS